MGRKLVASCCSQRSSGRHDPRRSLVRSPVGAAATAAEAVAVVVGAEEVAVTRDQSRVKGGKTVAVQMGHQKGAAIIAANRVTSPRNEGPRRR
jgi:hypothetical protein